MTDWVLTTEKVRNNMAFGVACAWVAENDPNPELESFMRNIDWPTPGLRPMIKELFDAWFNEEKAKAWDEGRRNGHREPFSGPVPGNPYRQDDQ